MRQISRTMAANAAQHSHNNENNATTAKTMVSIYTVFSDALWILQNGALQMESSNGKPMATQSTEPMTTISSTEHIV